MRRRASAYDAVTDVIAPPCCARRGVGAGAAARPCARFSTVSGSDDVVVDRMRRAGAASARPSRSPPPPPRAAPAAASAAGSRPSGERSAVCAKPVVSPRTTRSPAPRSRPETSSSTRPSSKRPLDDRRSSTNTSAKSPPSRNAWSSVACSTSVRSADSHVRLGIVRSRRHAESTPGAYRKRMALAPGLTASVTLVVDEADTALAIGSGDVPVLATPRVVALAEQATRRGDRRASSPDGQTTVGYEVQLAHLTPTPVGRHGGRRGDARAGRGPAAHVPRLGERRPRARRRGRITRVVVERDRFLERAQTEADDDAIRPVLLVERARRLRDAHAEPAREAQRARRSQLRDAISDALDDARRRRPTIKCVVITGAGPVFSAGFDLSEFDRAADDDAFGRELWASSDRYHETVLRFPLPTHRRGQRAGAGGRLRPRGPVRPAHRGDDRALRPSRAHVRRRRLRPAARSRRRRGRPRADDRRTRARPPTKRSPCTSSARSSSPTRSRRRARREAVDPRASPPPRDVLDAHEGQGPAPRRLRRRITEGTPSTPRHCLTGVAVRRGWRTGGRRRRGR